MGNLRPAEIVMNAAAPDLPFCETTKPVVPLFTWPVGAETLKPGGGDAGGAIVTTSDRGAPAPV
jgi:hypothetical protein